MPSVPTILRIILGIVNLLLFIGFCIVGIWGLLLRFNMKIVKVFITSISEKWPSDRVDEVARYIQSYGSGLSVSLIVFGFIAALVALLGVVALFWKVKFAAAIYIILITALTVVEMVFLFYILYERELHSLIDKVMYVSIKHVVNVDYLSEIALLFWNTVGEANSTFCCGMKGLEDFRNLEVKKENVTLPSACCSLHAFKNGVIYEPQFCSIASANFSRGCASRVYKFVESHKSCMVAIPAYLIGFQLLAVLVMGAFYSKWLNQLPHPLI